MDPTWQTKQRTKVISFLIIALADNNSLNDNDDVEAFDLLYGVDIENERRLKSKYQTPPSAHSNSSPLLIVCQFCFVFFFL